MYICRKEEMEKLSVVIITGNEERNIERCLASVQSVADEIIVVDSLSTDKTEEICRKFAVTFVSQKWLGYSEQKNYANSLASYDFILSIDADEVLSEELIQSILQEKNAGFPAKAYDFNRLTYFCGKPVKHCGWNHDYRVRLWQKNLAKWKGEIHELLSFETPIPVKRLSGDMLHYSFHSIEQHIDQVNKFSTLSAQAKFKKGKKSSIFAIVLQPIWRFIRMYFFQLGFLDGFTGLIVSADSAYAVFLKYSKLYILTKKK